MKVWKKPEVKVFNVKMNENIAASGDETQVIMHQVSGSLANTWKSYTYYVSGETIADTGIKYFYTASGGNTNYYTLASETEVASCLAG